MRARPNEPPAHRRVWRVLTLATAFACFALAAPAQRAGQPSGNPGGRPGGGAPGRAMPAPAPSRPMPSPAPQAGAPAGRQGFVERPSHGSIRHSETHVVPRAEGRHFEEHGGVAPHQQIIIPNPHQNKIIIPNPHQRIIIPRDLEARVHRHHHFDDFVFHRFVPVLPFGFFNLQVGGVPYFYSGGIYYQPMPGGYQEVYPPVGATVPEPPDGSIPIEAGGLTYYYAGGAFYLQQPDGTYQIAPTPIGVIVPELPPGAVEVALSDGSLAYQFNGVYYQPVFVDGITQYQTVTPH